MFAPASGRCDVFSTCNAHLFQLQAVLSAAADDQVAMMEEKVILINENDEVIGAESKKTSACSQLQASNGGCCEVSPGPQFFAHVFP